MSQPYHGGNMSQYLVMVDAKQMLDQWHDPIFFLELLHHIMTTYSTAWFYNPGVTFHDESSIQA